MEQSLVRIVLSRLIMLLALSLTLGCAITAGAGATAASAAGSPAAVVAPRVAPAGVARDAVTSTVGQIQTITSTSGSTVVYLPNQVMSGGKLRLLVHTVAFARVRLTVAFPDGSALKEQHHAGKTGWATFAPAISYQPQGSAELAAITVTAVLYRDGLDDAVQGSISVLQHEVLQGALKLPSSIAVGRMLPVTLVTQPGAAVRFVLVYPDKQLEHRWGGTVDASGVLAKSFYVSKADGTRGTLYVEALVSYNGVERHIWGKVALRAPNS